MKRTLKNLFSFLAIFAVVFSIGTEAMAAKKSKTLKNTIKKDTVRCGVSQGLPGFSNADASNNWTGVDVDVCRAVAAAVLGDANKVTFYPLSAKERFTALTSGEIDILSRNTTWTLSRDADIGLTFVGVNFYDGQGFMVRKNSGIKSTSQFQSGLSACVNIGTTTIPTAVVRISVDGEILEESATGDGPVAACFRAVKRAISLGEDVKLEHYQVRSVTSGKGALGEVVLRLRIKEDLFSGRGVSTDTIEASCKAYLDALNQFEKIKKLENNILPISSI